MSLFKNTEDLKEFYPARVTFDFDDIFPTLGEVEREYLVEQVLGEGQYNELHTAYQANSMSDPQSDLLAKCRTAVANLAVYHYTGIGNVEFSSGGLVTGMSEHKRPASEWRTRDLERAVLRKGYRGLDVLIGFLQANITDYPTYADSEQAAAFQSGFVQTTQQFGTAIGIGNSGYLFSRMKATLRRIENDTIKATLCSATLYQDLLEKRNDGTLSADEKTLVAQVQLAACHLTMADSVVELSLGLDDRGYWTFNSLLGGQTSGGPTAAADNRLQQRIDHHRNIGNAALASLTKELQRQAEANPSHPYRSSSCYVDPTAVVAPTPDPEAPVGNFL